MYKDIILYSYFMLVEIYCVRDLDTREWSHKGKCRKGHLLNVKWEKQTAQENALLAEVSNWNIKRQISSVNSAGGLNFSRIRREKTRWEILLVG